MLTFAGALRAVDQFLHVDAPEESLTPKSPVRYDHTLVRRLMIMHDGLNAQFAHLVCTIDSDPATAAHVSLECAEQFHELRRVESMWLYPIIARGLEDDPAARRQLVQLRMLMVALARRVVRQLEELTLAVESGEQPRNAADQASAPLAEYLRRSTFEIYPLYGLVGVRTAAPARA